jgi:hypothetical protein
MPNSALHYLKENKYLFPEVMMMMLFQTMVHPMVREANTNCGLSIQTIQTHLFKKMFAQTMLHPPVREAFFMH